MPFLSLSEFLDRYAGCQPVDIRTASLYALGHLPNAINIPFHFKAEDFQQTLSGWRNKSLPDPDIFIDNFSASNLALNRLTPAPADLVLYDAEGGISCKLLDLILSRSGMNYLFLAGGFSGFRAFQESFFYQPRHFILLTGKSGCGKTRTLRTLGSLGATVIDLEELAGHKGSVFGSGFPESQPTPQGFHNRLWEALKNIDPAERIFIEQKGDYVGQCPLPPGLLAQLKTARQIRLTASLNFRIRRLKAEYALLTKSALLAGLDKLKSKLDPLLFDDCRQAIEAGDRDRFVRQILRYYDKSRKYRFYQDHPWREVNAEMEDVEALGREILDLG